MKILHCSGGGDGGYKDFMTTTSSSSLCESSCELELKKKVSMLTNEEVVFGGGGGCHCLSSGRQRPSQFPLSGLTLGTPCVPLMPRPGSNVFERK